MHYSFEMWRAAKIPYEIDIQSNQLAASPADWLTGIVYW